MKEYLKGKKTYVTAAVAAVTAIGSYLTDSIELALLVEALFAIIMGVTLRAGMTNSAKEADPMQEVQNEK